MKYNELKLNRYYLVKDNFYKEELRGKPVKLIVLTHGDSYVLIESLEYINGHDGRTMISDISKGNYGKFGYCYYIEYSNLVKEISPDEAMVYEL